MNLSAPWYIYYSKIVELFKYDPDVCLEYKDEDDTIVIKVADLEKADAIEKLLPFEKVFGNVTVHIVVIPANKEEEDDITLFERAFKNNPIVIRTTTTKTPYGDTLDAVIFKKDVVQYYTDDILENNGYASTLYENIAEDVFGFADVCFWTDLG